MDDAREAIDALRQACERAKSQLGSCGSFRFRTLLGMILSEIDALQAAGGSAKFDDEADLHRD